MKAVTDTDGHIGSCHRVSLQSLLFILAAVGARGEGGLSAEASMAPGTFLNFGEARGSFS